MDKQGGVARKVSAVRPLFTILNGILLVVVALPAIAFDWYLIRICTIGNTALFGKTAEQSLLADGAYVAFFKKLLTPTGLCEIGLYHPILTVNIIFFLNVNVLFWIISLFQQSTWLIDPYWTIIPVMIAHFYQTHPLAVSDPTRGAILLVMVWIWSVRLTHSYFRREEWQLGAREDWRFTDMKKKNPLLWPLLSFVVVYLSQQVLLVGITIPFYFVFASSKPWDPVLDTLAVGMAFTGIVVAYFADTQLNEFMQMNERRKANGQPPIHILNSGLWYYSRHPNYFGEQLWWWGVALLGAHLVEGPSLVGGIGISGYGLLVFVGTFVNSLCLWQVTGMVEKRMADRDDRRVEWAE